MPQTIASSNNSSDKGSPLAQTYIINPNEDNLNTIPTEDLFTYVNLKVVPRHRSAIYTDGNKTSLDNDSYSDTEISFISTTNQNGKEYVTTNYTEIGGLGVESKSHNYEGLGIKEINIDNLSNFIPEVEIKFEDIRGAGLFDGHEKQVANERNEGPQKYFENDSIYSLFFNLPYPLFELTVKGFYGATAKYCLHLMDVKFNFNPDTGSFIMDCRFQGFSFAFLQDISLKHVAAIAQIAESNNIDLLEEYNVININEFLQKLASVDLLIDEEKENSDSYKKLREYNQIANTITEIDKLIGAKIINDPFLTNPISTSYILGNNQLSLNNISIIKSENNTDKLNNLFELVNKKINIINDYVRNSTFPTYEITDSEIFSEGSVYGDSGETLIRQFNLINSNSDSSFLGRPEILNKFQNLQSDTKFRLINLNNIRQQLFDLKTLLEDEKRNLQNNVIDEINETLNSTYNFNLTIYRVFEIILGNVEVYLKTIFNTAVEAQNYSEQRKNIINEINLSTDNAPNNNTIYPFPAVYDSLTGEERWIGDLIKGDNEKYFPEIKLIETLLRNLTKSSSQRDRLNNIQNNFTRFKQDTNNWYPINPLDYSQNEFFKAGATSLSETINDNVFTIITPIVNVLISRFYIYNNYSRYSQLSINELAKIEASFLYNILDQILIEKIIHDSPSELLASNTILLNSNIQGEVIINDININTLSRTVYFNDVKYDNIGYGINNNNIRLNNKNLNEITPFLKNLPKNLINTNNLNIDNNLNAIKDYTISFFKEPYRSIVTKIYGKNSKNYNITEKLNTTAISKVSQNFSDYFDEFFTDYSFITSGATYENNVEEVMNHLLSLYNVNEFNKILEDFKSCSISVKIPLFVFVHFIYSKDENIDLYNFIRNDFQNFENYFENFKNNILTTYIDDFLILKEGDETKELDKSKQRISNFLTSYMTITSVTPSRFQSEDEIIISTNINSNDLNNYLTSFIGVLKKCNENVKTQEDILNDINKNVMDDSDIKLSTYNNIKNVYDKWITDVDEGKIFNFCGRYSKSLSEDVKKKKLIDYFHFVDSRYNFIGDKLSLDPRLMLTLTANPEISLQTYIGTLISESNMIFQALPYNMFFSQNNIDEEVKNMFKPYTNIEYFKGTPAFMCIYLNSNSRHLDIDFTSYSNFENDGYDFRENSELPEGHTNRRIDSTKSYEEQMMYTVPAFLVAYGQQNQSIFTGFDIDMNNIKETYPSLRVLSELFDKKSASQRIYKSSALYQYYKSRGYQATITCLGNMMIQPMQFFQLDNIPFFHGAYLITKVSHNITPHYITTSFTGVRQSKYSIPVINQVLSFINVDFDEVENINDTTTVIRLSDSPTERIEIVEAEAINTITTNSTELLPITNSLGLVVQRVQGQVLSNSELLLDNLNISEDFSTPERAMLDTIAYAEQTFREGDFKGYDQIVSFITINDYNFNYTEGHPNISVPVGDLISTAAGRYQFIYSTWLGLNNNINKAFSAKNQDISALKLINRKLNNTKINNTPKLNEITDINSFERVISSLASTWASFPYTVNYLTDPDEYVVNSKVSKKGTGYYSSDNVNNNALNITHLWEVYNKLLNQYDILNGK